MASFSQTVSHNPIVRYIWSYPVCWCALTYCIACTMSVCVWCLATLPFILYGVYYHIIFLYILFMCDLFSGSCVLVD